MPVAHDGAATEWAEGVSVPVDEGHLPWVLVGEGFSAANDPVHNFRLWSIGKKFQISKQGLGIGVHSRVGNPTETSDWICVCVKRKEI